MPAAGNPLDFIPPWMVACLHGYHACIRTILASKAHLVAGYLVNRPAPQQPGGVANDRPWRRGMRRDNRVPSNEDVIALNEDGIAFLRPLLSLKGAQTFVTASGHQQIALKCPHPVSQGNLL